MDTLEKSIDYFYRELSGVIGGFQGIRFILAPTTDEACYLALEHQYAPYDRSEQVVRKGKELGYFVKTPLVDPSRTPSFKSHHFFLVRDKFKIGQPPKEDPDDHAEFEGLSAQISSAETELRRLNSSWFAGKERRKDLKKAMGLLRNRVIGLSPRVEAAGAELERLRAQISSAESELQRLNSSWFAGKERRKDLGDEIGLLRGDFINLSRGVEAFRYQKKAWSLLQERVAQSPYFALAHMGYGLNRGVYGEPRNPPSFFYLIGNQTTTDQFMDLVLSTPGSAYEIVKGLIDRAKYGCIDSTYRENCQWRGLKDPDNKFLPREENYLGTAKKQHPFTHPPRVIAIADLPTGRGNSVS